MNSGVIVDLRAVISDQCPGLADLASADRLAGASGASRRALDPEMDARPFYPADPEAVDCPRPSRNATEAPAAR